MILKFDSADHIRMTTAPVELFLKLSRDLFWYRVFFGRFVVAREIFDLLPKLIVLLDECLFAFQLLP